MATIQGMYDTTGFLSSQRPNDWREGLLLYYPSGKFPMTALTSLMRKETCKDPKFNWHEKPWASRQLELDADLLAVATSVTVTEGALNLVAGNLLLVEETGEIIEVLTTPTVDTTIPSIGREVGDDDDTLAQDIDYDGAGVNPKISVIGTRHPEGADTPDPVHIQPVARYNYTQIFRNSLSLTRTAQNTYLRTGEQVKESKRECLENHATDMERAFFWGQKGEVTSPVPKRATDGIINVIRTYGDSDNEHDFVSTGMTISLLETWLEKVFRFGGDQKLCFCGNTFLLTINQAIRLAAHTQYMLSSSEKLYGLNIQRLTCPFGEVFMKPHPLFNAMPDGSDYWSYASSGVFIDTQFLRYRPLRNSDTKYLANRQGNGLDGMTSEFLTECGLEVDVAKSHSLWTGVKAAS